MDNTGRRSHTEDRVVTLSTCTGDDSTRFVVMGRLAQVYASKTDETKNTDGNGNCPIGVTKIQIKAEVVLQKKE